MKKAFHFTVRGDVQGVGFRFFTRETATRIGLNGWVRNNFDGSVSVYAEGSSEQLELFEMELAGGPRFSTVSSLSKEEREPEGIYNGFSIIL